jgi:hypothetical protein
MKCACIYRTCSWPNRMYHLLHVCIFLTISLPSCQLKALPNHVFIPLRYHCVVGGIWSKVSTPNTADPLQIQPRLDIDTSPGLMQRLAGTVQDSCSFHFAACSSSLHHCRLIGCRPLPGTATACGRSDCFGLLLCDSTSLQLLSTQTQHALSHAW